MRTAERPAPNFILTLLTLLLASWVGIQQLVIMRGQEKRELERLAASPKIEVSIPNHWAQSVSSDGLGKINPLAKLSSRLSQEVTHQNRGPQPRYEHRAAHGPTSRA